MLERQTKDLQTEVQRLQQQITTMTGGTVTQTPRSPPQLQGGRYPEIPHPFPTQRILREDEFKIEDLPDDTLTESFETLPESRL